MSGPEPMLKLYLDSKNFEFAVCMFNKFRFMNTFVSVPWHSKETMNVRRAMPRGPLHTESELLNVPSFKSSLLTWHRTLLIFAEKIITFRTCTMCRSFNGFMRVTSIECLHLHALHTLLGKVLCTQLSYISIECLHMHSVWFDLFGCAPQVLPVVTSLMTYPCFSGKFYGRRFHGNDARKNFAYLHDASLHTCAHIHICGHIHTYLREHPHVHMHTRTHKLIAHYRPTPKHTRAQHVPSLCLCIMLWRENFYVVPIRSPGYTPR